MDAEPFQKVVPSQCLGSTWSKRNKPGSEHLAHTVQANIDHFRRVANLVITTCLGVPSMMAQDRVRVVERWIQVAQECEILKNFSSPRTVISSLQKTSICHLKNTWRKFPGGALHVCPPEGNPQRVQEKQQQQQVKHQG
ncbi:ral guanine nucleotide dissociation stimulator-like isoform X5 [Diceros bicornis minor]|uniref:ral guanine nucleotide dissociation stimulator-like isoform X5 n=1 Tax=Diceros bicornis minor TaxID=77932 RepID=UPI0026F29A1D|nr:ral guanine nucleotide dissociation stimulator-like isoform X5 [Diceros bicornis minor]